jgi:purine-binding chemotaxis protein CheW
LTAESLGETTIVPTNGDQAVATPWKISSDFEQMGVAQDDRKADVTDKNYSVPQWAKGNFQCLMFKVGAINLAAPLDKLNGILEWPENITLLPGRAPWMLGLIRNRMQTVQIVDLGYVINETGTNVEKTRAKRTCSSRYVILIGNGDWGVVADAVANVLTLQHQEVRWHGLRKRQWLCGTVVDEMCTLLDIDNLILDFNSGFTREFKIGYP